MFANELLAAPGGTEVEPLAFPFEPDRLVGFEAHAADGVCEETGKLLELSILERERRIRFRPQFEAR